MSGAIPPLSIRLHGVDRDKFTSLYALLGTSNSFNYNIFCYGGCCTAVDQLTV